MGGLLFGWGFARVVLVCGSVVDVCANRWRGVVWWGAGHYPGSGRSGARASRRPPLVRGGSLGVSWFAGCACRCHVFQWPCRSSVAPLTGEATPARGAPSLDAGRAAWLRGFSVAR